MNLSDKIFGGDSLAQTKAVISRNEKTAEAEKKIKKTPDGKFISGILILSISNILVKIIGLLFKIPMSHIIGDIGMGYFNSAYSVYTFLYMLSTSGLPVALAVMVSENKTAGKVTTSKAAYRTALVLFFIIGFTASAVMLFASDGLAELIKSDKSAFSIMVAAPTMLFICISSAIRGYFQGCGNMIPTAVSQGVEALGKLIIGIGAAVYAIRRGYEIHIISAYAVSGLTLGAFAGMLFLFIVKFMRGDKDMLPPDLNIRNEKTEYKAIIYRFIKISLPITVSASVMSLSNMIDTAMIQRVLQSTGISAENAAALFGNYTSLAVPMFNFPPIFVYPIAYSIVPAIAASVSSKNIKKCRELTELSLRAAVIIGLPCAVGLSVLSDPLLCLFYKAESAHLASPSLSILAPSSFFVCILAVTNSILQSCGKERIPLISMLIGAAVKCATSPFLLRTYGIYGAPMSTFLCYLTITLLNLIFIQKCTGVKPKFTKIFISPALSSAACAVCAVLTCNSLSSFLSNSLSCICSVFLSAAVYAVVLLLTGGISTDEIKILLKRNGKTNNVKNIRTEKQAYIRKSS